MSLKITYLGHSGFIFDDGSHPCVVDPFLSGNSLAKHKPADVKCTHIALTHGHYDHVGDTIEIAKANQATCIAVFEITGLLNDKGIAEDKVEPGNPGGKIHTPFGWVAFTPALHSSSYEGQYMGQPCGLVINIGGATIYHAGDTALFSDMKLIAEIYKPDIACLPIGDRFTMDAKQASMAAEWIKPKFAIPIHYKTFPIIAQSAEGFAPRGVEVKELSPGEEWSYTK
ncbi:MAG: metal-dependent hydrolase [Phycisphaerae bacterium]